MRRPTPVGVKQGRVETLTKMRKRTKNAVKKEALKGAIKSMKRTNVNNVTDQFAIMTIPKEIKTQGTIMNTEGQNLIVKLPKKLMNELEDIYNMSEKKQHEFAGLIECTFDANYALVKSHTMRTNYSRGTVAPPQRTKETSIMYHSHPAPKPKETGTTIVSIPSDTDFATYLNAQEKGIVEGNLILDQNGVYVIDVVNFKKQGIFQYFLNLIKSQGGFNYMIKNDLFFMNIDVNTWQKFINGKVDILLKKEFGVSMKFYKWSELPTMRIRARKKM